MKPTKVAVSLGIIFYLVSGISTASNVSSQSVFAGSSPISPEQVAKFDASYKTDEQLQWSMGVLSYTNFSDLMSKDDRMALFTVKRFWNDNRPDSSIWKVEESARTQTILTYGIFNTKETLIKKMEDNPELAKQFNQALSYIRSYKSFVLYKKHGPKATNANELRGEAQNNYYCAGVMTNAVAYYHNKFTASLEYAKVIKDTLFDKGPQYKALGAINDEEAKEYMMKGVDANINSSTKFSSFDSCFQTARNKFYIT